MWTKWLRPAVNHQTLVCLSFGHWHLLYIPFLLQCRHTSIQVYVCPFSAVLSLCPSLSHACHSFRVPLRWADLLNLLHWLKKKKTEALNMSSWHLSRHSSITLSKDRTESFPDSPCMKIKFDNCLVSTWLSHYDCTITATLRVIPCLIKWIWQ